MQVPTENAGAPLPKLGPWSWLLGFMAMACANALVAAVRVRAPVDARLWFHLYDIFHFAALGLASTAVVIGSRRATSRKHADVLGIGIAALLIGLAALTPDLRGPAARLQASLGFSGLAPLLALATALLVPAAYIAGGVVGRSKWRILVLAVPAVTGPLNLLIFTQLLPGAHLYLAWGTAAVIAGAYRESTALSRWRTSRRSRIALAALCGFAFLTVVLPPPPRGGTILGQVSGSTLYPFISRLHAARVRTWLPDPMPDGEWFVPRERSSHATPPTSPAPSRPSIVILISIDAMRADVLTNPETAGDLPNLSAIRDRGTSFERAWSPSNATVPSLTAIFTGKYYSQLYWTTVEDDPGGKELWPHEDDSVRFPEVLSSNGVRTVTYAPAYWLLNRFGVARGFDDEAYIDAKRSVGPRHASRWASAQETTSRLRKRLRMVARAESRRMFFFLHILEPHYPYNQGRNESSDSFSRYLTELAVVDRSIGKLLDEIDELGIRDRTALIVTSDHGEAFGEHGTLKHGSTLYDEVARVPLLFVGPGIVQSANQTPVSLVDLGPTILDLYGVGTPPEFMGQSLVPLLRGQEAELTRPIAIEGRPKQAMVFHDGMKVIRDLRTGLMEAYDLDEDPEELDNLYGGWINTLEEYFGPLAAFFHVHEIQREGYEVHGR